MAKKQPPPTTSSSFHFYDDEPRWHLSTQNLLAWAFGLLALLQFVQFWFLMCMIRNRFDVVDALLGAVR